MEKLSMVEKIPCSMNSGFEYVVCSIEESNNVTTMYIEELQSKLLVHESRMKGHREEEQALKVTVGGRTRTRGRGTGRGRGRGRQYPCKESIECYRCSKLGHYKNQCPSWEEGANFAEFDGEEEILLMAVTNQQKNEERKKGL